MAEIIKIELPLVLYAPPGGGKGTLANNLASLFGIRPLSVGEKFRNQIESGTPLGKEISGYVSSGTLAPDHIAVCVVEQELLTGAYATGVAIDGCPRTLAQAKLLDAMLDLHSIDLKHVIVLEPSDEVIIERLSNRLNCRSCGRSYHRISKRPPKEGVCECGGELFQRADDVPDTIRKRLDIYKAQSRPILNYYGNKVIMVHPEADESEQSVLRKVLAQMM